jgi:hypothetical protein
MKIIMTDELDGFAMDPINNVDALSHPGLKVVIKKAKKRLISDSALIEYLSKTFARRLMWLNKVILYSLTPLLTVFYVSSMLSEL